MENDFDRLADYLWSCIVPALEAVGSKTATPGIEPTDLELKCLEEDLDKAQRDIQAVQERVAQTLYKRC